MKHIQTVFKSLTAIALVVLAVLPLGCATTGLQSKEEMASAAGFKVITPNKADQMTLLTTLPAGKVTPITYDGKGYFVLPDAKNNRAYVGGQTEYQAYERLHMDKQMSSDNLTAAEMNQNASMHDWGAWNDWGRVAPLGFRR